MECDRKPGLPVVQQVMQTGIRVGCCAEAAELAHRPQPAPVHLGIDAAGVGRFTRITEMYRRDRKSTRLNSSHTVSSYAVFCLKKNTDSGARPPSYLAETATLLAKGAPIGDLAWARIFPWQSLAADTLDVPDLREHRGHLRRAR